MRIYSHVIKPAHVREVARDTGTELVRLNKVTSLLTGDRLYLEALFSRADIPVEDRLVTYGGERHATDQDTNALVTAALLSIDPEASVNNYKGWDDFHHRTRGRFLHGMPQGHHGLHEWEERHCTICDVPQFPAWDIELSDSGGDGAGGG